MNAQPTRHRVILTVISAVIAAALLSSISVPSSAEPRSHYDLWEDVWALRRAGRYAEAASVADTLVAVRESDPDMPVHEIESARGLAQTMHAAAALPETEQRELARTDSLMGYLENMADHEAGAAMARQHLEIRRRLLGADHPGLSWSLSALAQHLTDSGDVTGALRCREEAVQISLASWGDAHPFTADYMNSLALEYRQQGDYTSAEQHYRRAIEICERGLGPDDPRVGEMMTRLMFTFFRLGRYGDTDAVGKEILERWPDVADLTGGVHTVLCFSAEGQGDFAAAEAHARSAYQIKKSAFGPDDPDAARAARDLAVQAYRRGDIVAAEAIAREALARITAAYGPRNTSTALAIQLLSGIHSARGDHVRSEAEAREVLDIYSETRGDEHIDVASCLGFLAGVIGAGGDHARAASYRAEALATARRALEEGNPHIVQIIAGLSMDYIALGDVAAAELLLREALEIDRRAATGPGLTEAQHIRLLGDCRRGQGDLAGAEGLYGDCLAIERAMLGVQHQRLSLTLTGLGTIRHALGDYSEAESLFAEAAVVHDAARLRVGTGMQRASYGKVSPYGWLALCQIEQEKANAAWESVERSSARALADLLADAERRALTSHEAAREDSIRDLMVELERQVATYAESAQTDSTAAAELHAGKEALAAAEAAWSSFRYDMSLLHPESEGRVLELAEVQAALDAETALVGWLDVKKFDGVTESWVYLVRDRGAVSWARLEDTGRGAVVGAVRDVIADPSSPLIGVARETRALWRKRFAPVESALEGVRNLVVVPSGPLLGVPVEALVIGDGRLAGEAFEVSYSPSGTVYARLGSGEFAQVDPQRSLLIGDPPLLEEHLAEMDSESESPWEILATCDAYQSDGALFRSAMAGDRDALAGLPRLRGTRAEVMLLEGLTPDALVLLGSDASEQELTALVRGGTLAEYGTIHIATHALVDDKHPEQSALVLSQVGLPDPLEAALAGERIYDGLLTAKEIVAECHLNADLVTLSACETGLGQEIVGEGYVGFAHAFLQAGARSLVVSLWKVEDTATALLMQRFYENRWGYYADERSGRIAEPFPKAEALAEAKAWLRGYEDESGVRHYEHPYYWSAFILIGDRS